MISGGPHDDEGGEELVALSSDHHTSLVFAPVGGWVVGGARHADASPLLERLSAPYGGTVTARSQSPSRPLVPPEDPRAPEGHPVFRLRVDLRTTVSLVALTLGVALVVGCGGDGGGSSECNGIANDALSQDGIDLAGATEAPPDPLTDEPRWYIASPTGGLWVTTASPEVASEGGLVIPLNDQARSESQVGVDAPASLVGDVDAGSAEARAALACAEG